MLTGSNLDMNVCPYALYYYIQFYNYFPEPNTINYLIEKDTPKWENLYSLMNFVCQVYELF